MALRLLVILLLLLSLLSGYFFCSWYSFYLCSCSSWLSLLSCSPLSQIFPECPKPSNVEEFGFPQECIVVWYSHHFTLYSWLCWIIQLLTSDPISNSESNCWLSCWSKPMDVYKLPDKVKQSLSDETVEKPVSTDFEVWNKLKHVKSSKSTKSSVAGHSAPTVCLTGPQTVWSRCNFTHHCTVWSHKVGKT